jgi:chemotaxis protein methyltransferase WspC
LSDVFNQIEALLLRTVGFDKAVLSSKVIRQCVEGRMFLLGMPQMADYLALLQRDAEELDDLVNTIVVPETWFFRDHAPFEFLRLFIREEWLPRFSSRPLRILSIPCSTGEEPYSIAMTLLELPMKRDQFKIDAVDISQRALEWAKKGLYHRHSFRGARSSGFMHFFQEGPEGFQLSSDVMATVEFTRANAMEYAASVPDGTYDIVFCRNLLIYLDEKARHTLITQLERALVPEGIFFLGHAEAPCVFLPAYEAVAFPGSFAVRKRSPTRRLTEPVPSKKLAGVPSVPRMVAPPPAAKKPDLAEAPVVDESLDQWLEQARQCADRGEYGQARQCCEKVLKKKPFCTEAFYLSGVAALADGDEDLAMDFFHKTVYLEPDHEEALIHLSLLMEKKGERAQAARYRQMAGRKVEHAGLRGRTT